MEGFFYHAILWTLAIYGLLEIIKTIFYLCTYTNLKADGLYVIIAAKNQENTVEGFLRSILFKIIYGKEEAIKNIIVTDLDSTDDTKKILEKMQEDYDCIKTVSWRECKDILDNVDTIKTK